jgi:hypothetical protein
VTRGRALRRTGVYRSARFSTSASGESVYPSLLTTAVLLFGGVISILRLELPVVWEWSLVVSLAFGLSLRFLSRVRRRR